ncbi:MAG: hypothetical protein GY874_21635 [Desulfobacteraceae bacterium]|nr:hypothetical protein [Desulfobacteraceae bacterium]
MKIDDSKAIRLQIPVYRTDPYLNNKKKGQDNLVKHLPHQIKRKHASDNVTLSSQDRIQLNKLNGANSKANTLAQQLRSVDKNIDKIEHNLRQMMGALDKVVKHYPPFTVDSKERSEYLRQFNSLRKMIDQLTVPAPEKSPEKISGADNGTPSGGDWSYRADESSPAMVIRHQRLHTGPEGLNIESLPEDASDKIINRAFARLAEAEKTIHERRNAFAAEANKLMTSITT